MNRKLLNGVIVLLAAVCCPGSLIAAVAGGSVVGSLAQASQVPEEALIAVRAPGTVAVGQTAIIEIQVKNDGENPMILNSIDVFSRFADAITIENSIPPFNYAENSFGFQSYFYQRDILPGDTLTIKMEAVSQEAGRFPLEADVCIDSPFSCSRFQFEIVAISAG